MSPAVGSPPHSEPPFDNVPQRNKTSGTPKGTLNRQGSMTLP
jgi:hypothetical protein